MTHINRKYLGLCFVGVILGVVLIAVSCQKHYLRNTSSVTTGGIASASPIANATITEYSLNSDGTLGTQIVTTTTDSHGAYSILLGVSSTPVAIVLTGGSYVEEVGGSTVSLGVSDQLRVFLPSVSIGQDIGITPFTEIAAARVLSLLGAGATDLSGTITSVNDLMAISTGLSSIVTSPADITSTISDPNSNAGIYAALLAGLSQFAHNHSLASSLVAMSVYSSDFHRDGVFNGRDNASTISFGGGLGNLAVNDWATGLHSAVSTYVTSSAGITAGLSASQVTTLIDNPADPSACPSGLSACGSSCVDLTADTSNCGACSTVCSGTNVSAAICNNSACETTACTSGYDDCDAVFANGCETHLTNDSANCGACGTSCSRPNMTTSCVSGSCSFSTCSSGYGNCNGSTSDGCETNLNTDTNNCGSCSHVCSAGSNVSAMTCTTGSCAIGTCQPGFADCDLNPTNGCELSVTSDTNNCGSCGHVCAMGQTCAGGSCI